MPKEGAITDDILLDRHCPRISETGWQLSKAKHMAQRKTLSMLEGMLSVTALAGSVGVIHKYHCPVLGMSAAG